MARRLAPVFADGVADYHRGADEDEAGRIGAARHADVAAEIERVAERFLKSLDRKGRFVRAAIRRKYVDPSVFVPTDRQTRVGDMNCWLAEAQAREAVTKIIHDARRWRLRARAGRPPRLRPVSGDAGFIEWVGIRLAAQGIRLTKARNGEFARVLHVVRRAAGLPDAEVIRSIRQVLGDAAFQRVLTDVYARRGGTSTG